MEEKQNNNGTVNIKQQLKAAEKVIAKYQEKIFLQEQIFENSVPLCVTDKDFNIIHINADYAEFFNKTSDECLGKKCFMNRTTEECHTHECPMRIILEGKKTATSYESTLIKPDGEEVPYQAIAKPFYDHEGNIVGITESFHVLYRRKALERKLHESEHFLHDVLDAIQDGIAVLDPDLNILQVNQTMQDMHRGEKIIGAKCHKVFHNLKKPCEVCPSLRALESGTLEKNEIISHKSDKESGFRELYAFPMKNDKGEIVGVVEYVRDITERRRAEESKENLINELSNALSEIKELQGILPICSYCKKIRNDDGYWDQLEQYISHHTDAQFSHTICIDCLKKEYPEIYAKRHEIKGGK